MQPNKTWDAMMVKSMIQATDAMVVVKSMIHATIVTRCEIPWQIQIKGYSEERFLTETFLAFYNHPAHPGESLLHEGVEPDRSQTTMR